MYVYLTTKNVFLNMFDMIEITAQFIFEDQWNVPVAIYNGWMLYMVR